MIDANKMNQIKELINLAKEMKVASFAFEDEDLNVAFEFECEHHEEHHHHETQEPMAEEPKTQLGSEKTFLVESPLGGTFYATPAPGAEAFVQPGSVVSAGDTLCIIEAMKVMNEIVTDRPGKIIEIYCTNGKEISAGVPLFLLEEI